MVSLNPLVFSYSPLCRQQPKRLLKNIKQMSYDVNFFCSQEIRSKHHKAYKAYRIWPIATFQRLNLVPVSLFLQSDMLAFLLFSKYAIFTTISGQYLYQEGFLPGLSWAHSFFFQVQVLPFQREVFPDHRICRIITYTGPPSLFPLPLTPPFLHCGHHYLIFSACPCACLFS